MASQHEEGQLDETRPLKSPSPGTLISHYKILGKIGAGGMGVVYKAEDTKLKRSVALKFLPLHLTQDPSAKQRFVYEAQAASALDHSNICTIYEIDETKDGQMFIAMSCYEGETVKRKIERGPLELTEAIDIAIQVGEGLKEAHETGIVHRDIKPGNIIVTTKGQVKVMDFGLAKLMGQTRLTKTGATLGTVAYMSPEQARGQDVDDRTDTWSLGVVLYEMITGNLPFKGEYEQVVIYSILNEEPEAIMSLRPDAPPELDRIVGKSLTKGRGDRYQRVDEMLYDLRQLKGELSKAAPGPIKMLKRPYLTWNLPGIRQEMKVRTTWVVYLAFVALLLVLVVVLFPYLRSTEPVLPTHRQITFTGKADRPAISPDGNLIAYVSTDSAGEQRILVQDLAGGKPLEVFKDQDIEDLRWSPDGTELLISAWNDSSAGTYLVPRFGGMSQRLTYFYRVDWSPDGSCIAGILMSRKWINLMNRSTGDTSSFELTGSFTWLTDFDWSPVGDLVLFLTTESGDVDRGPGAIWTVRSDGSRQQKVFEDSLPVSSPHWSSDGDAIYYLRHVGQATDLMRIKVASATGKVKGHPVPIQTGLQAGPLFTISKDGNKILYTRKQRYSNLWSARRDGETATGTVRTKQLTTGTSLVSGPSISPDGNSIVFSMEAQSGRNIFTMSMEGGPMKQLTFLNSDETFPVWSPDGKEIAFVSDHEGTPKVWRVSSVGGTPRVFDSTECGTARLAWAPGPGILYHRPGNRNFHVLNPDTETERPLVENEEVGWMFWPCYAPDGNRIAVSWNRRPELGLWLISLDDSSQVRLCPWLGLFDYPIRWSADGDWIYAKDWLRPEILRIPVTGGEPKKFLTLPFEDIDDGGIAMTPDGKNIVCTVSESLSDIWLMENFDPEVR